MSTVKEPKAPKAPKAVKVTPAKAPKASKPVQPKIAKITGYDFSKSAKPSALLVPKSVRDAHGLVGTIRASLISVAGVAVVLALASVGLGAGAAAAEAHERDVVAVGATQQTKLDALQGVQDYYTGFEERRATVGSALQTDVDYARVVNAIYATLPAGSGIKSISTAFGVVCPGGEPFAQEPAVGCVTVQVTAPDQASVGTFSGNLLAAPDGLLVAPYATSISTADASTTFQMTVNFSNVGYSGKFAQYTSTIDALDQASAPAADATDDASAPKTTTGD